MITTTITFEASLDPADPGAPGFTIPPAALAALTKILSRTTLAVLVGEAMINANRIAESAPAPERLLLVPEVAAILRCSTGHVYELIQEGSLTAIRGKPMVVRQSAVDEYLARREHRDPVTLRLTNVLEMAPTTKRRARR